MESVIMMDLMREENQIQGDQMNSICKGCGKEIIWGMMSNGKKISLDPRAPIYSIMSRDPVYGFYEVSRIELETAMVSHFATCAKANDFSGKNKK